LRKSGLDLNPFHQFVNEVLEGDAAETEDGFEGGSERDDRDCC
jgi:hypothetical protein